MMPFYIVPSHISFGLDKETRDFIAKVLDQFTGNERFGAAANSLDASTKSLQNVVDANTPPTK
jgi:hypothetical protein